jgi:hypothetical protein
VTWIGWAHLTLAGAWLLLLYPTIRWWRDSITFVVFMSLYAIIVSHLSAFSAATH